MSKCIGIYGGTFAPVHNGHIRVAEAFKRAFPLDTLLIIPTYLPPHKAPSTDDSPEHRYNMLKLAFDTPCYRELGIEVCDYELSKKGKSYTVDTLEHFKNEDTDLYMLCGTDMLLTMDTWKDPERIAQLATLVFARREEADAELNLQISEKTAYLKDRFGFTIKELMLPPYEMSSTFIRDNINTEASNHLPQAVLEYIKKNKLYGGNA